MVSAVELNHNIKFSYSHKVYFLLGNRKWGFL